MFQLLLCSKQTKGKVKSQNGQKQAKTNAMGGVGYVRVHDTGVALT